MIDVRQFISSLSHAIHGIKVVFKTEQSFRIQLLGAVVVVIFAAMFGVSVYEWIVLLLLIGITLALELINSIFERIVDAFKPRIHPTVRDVKDIMAAAVLVMSILSAVVGVVIFWPYLLQFVLA